MALASSSRAKSTDCSFHSRTVSLKSRSTSAGSERHVAQHLLLQHLPARRSPRSALMPSSTSGSSSIPMASPSMHHQLGVDRAGSRWPWGPASRPAAPSRTRRGRRRAPSRGRRPSRRCRPRRWRRGSCRTSRRRAGPSRARCRRPARRGRRWPRTGTEDLRKIHMPPEPGCWGAGAGSAACAAKERRGREEPEKNQFVEHAALRGSLGRPRVGVGRGSSVQPACPLVPGRSTSMSLKLEDKSDRAESPSGASIAHPVGS